MASLNGLPVFKITFNEDLDNVEGIDFVSLVDYPAIESNWVALSKEQTKSPLKFTFDQDKQILYGPILIPDKPIYRYNDGTGEEFYVVFPKEVVERLVRKFQKQAKTINLNYQHQKDSRINEAVIQEIWLTGKVDKSQTLGFDLPEGSGFVAAHIGDSKFWAEEIKSGNVRGFSIEGFLDMEMKKLTKKIIMQSQFITAKTETGIEVKSDGESFVSGADVYTETDGNKTPLADGEYKLENGTTLSVEGGKIKEVKEAATPEEKEAEEVIQSAVKPLIDALKAELKSQKEAYEAKVAELETRLSNLPAQKKEEKQEPKKQLTVKQALDTKLSVLRKKSQEVTKK